MVPIRSLLITGYVCNACMLRQVSLAKRRCLSLPACKTAEYASRLEFPCRRKAHLYPAFIQPVELSAGDPHVIHRKPSSAPVTICYEQPHHHRLLDGHAPGLSPHVPPLSARPTTPWNRHHLCYLHPQAVEAVQPRAARPSGNPTPEGSPPLPVGMHPCRCLGAATDLSTGVLRRPGHQERSFQAARRNGGRCWCKAEGRQLRRKYEYPPPPPGKKNTSPGRKLEKSWLVAGSSPPSHTDESVLCYAGASESAYLFKFTACTHEKCWHRPVQVY